MHIFLKRSSITLPRQRKFAGRCSSLMLQVVLSGPHFFLPEFQELKVQCCLLRTPDVFWKFVVLFTSYQLSATKRWNVLEVLPKVAFDVKTFRRLQPKMDFRSYLSEEDIDCSPRRRCRIQPTFGKTSGVGSKEHWPFGSWIDVQGKTFYWLREQKNCNRGSVSDVDKLRSGILTVSFRQLSLQAKMWEACTVHGSKMRWSPHKSNIFLMGIFLDTLFHLILTTVHK